MSLIRKEENNHYYLTIHFPPLPSSIKIRDLAAFLHGTCNKVIRNKRDKQKCFKLKQFKPLIASPFIHLPSLKMTLHVQQPSSVGGY